MGPIVLGVWQDHAKRPRSKAGLPPDPKRARPGGSPSCSDRLRLMEIRIGSYHDLTVQKPFHGNIPKVSRSFRMVYQMNDGQLLGSIEDGLYVNNWGAKPPQQKREESR